MGTDVRGTDHGLAKGTDRAPAQDPSVPLSSPAKPMPSPAKPMPSPAKPMPSPAKPMPSPMKPMPSPAKPMPSPVKPMPSPAKPMPSPAKPMPSPVKPMPSPLKLMPTPVKPMPSPAAPLTLSDSTPASPITALASPFTDTASPAASLASEPAGVSDDGPSCSHGPPCKPPPRKRQATKKIRQFKVPGAGVKSTPTPSHRKHTSAHTPKAKKRPHEPATGRDRSSKALAGTRTKCHARRLTLNEALNRIKPLVPRGLFTLTKAHIRLRSFPKFKKHWSREMKQFSLNLFFRSPEAYRIFRELLCLPRVGTLRRWLADMHPMKPGVIPGVMDTIETITKDWPLQDKACCLLFDEIPLKESLMYDQSKDIVLGLSDDGNSRTNRMANTALIVAVSGISRKWMQPVAFVVSHDATPALVVRQLLFALIQQLETKGLLVKALVCDQDSNNVSLLKMLVRSFHEPTFLVNGRKMYFLFDTAHLIKVTRNNLKGNKLTIGSEVVDWKHIETMYETTRSADRTSDAPAELLKTKLVKKLRLQHIRKMSSTDMAVKYATQIFSESVSTALLILMAIGELPADAKATAEFVERMDRLFDCLNSSAVKKQNEKMRYAMSDGSEHQSFLEACITWISGWHFGGPRSRQPHAIKGWQITIKAVLLLWIDLKQEFGFSYLLTRRLQLGTLENFLATIRHKLGSKEAPNMCQFMDSFKNFWIKKLFRLATQGKCEATGAFLANIEEALAFVPLSGAPALSRSRRHESVCASVQVPLQESTGITCENVVYHITGTLVKDFLNLRPVDCTCHGTLLDKGGGASSKRDKFFALLKEDGVAECLFSAIAETAEECLNYMKELDRCFNEEIAYIIHCTKICKYLVQVMPKQPDLFCSPACNSKYLSMFCHRRLCWHISFANKNVENRPSRSAAARKISKLSNLSAQIPNVITTDNKVRETCLPVRGSSISAQV